MERTQQTTWSWRNTVLVAAIAVSASVLARFGSASAFTAVLTVYMLFAAAAAFRCGWRSQSDGAAGAGQLALLTGFGFLILVQRTRFWWSLWWAVPLVLLPGLGWRLGRWLHGRRV